MATLRLPAMRICCQKASICLSASLSQSSIVSKQFSLSLTKVWSIKMFRWPLELSIVITVQHHQTYCSVAI